MAPKRKHLNLQEKVNIIEEWNKSFGVSKVQFARQCQLPESTLKGILASKDKILEAAQSYGSTSKRQIIRGGRSEEFDKALLQWFNEARASNIPLSGVIFKENAANLATKLELQNFQASSGWLTKFKKRHGLSFKSMCGESGSVDEKIVDEWKVELKRILEGYDEKNIFNADETGLFYSVVPSKTLTYKAEKCFGGKRSKERLTVLLCANSDGSEKLPPLVIGKSKQPRCFKNVLRKPCEYQSNNKAWMTSAIFTDWIRNFDAKMRREERKVLLLIDRCTAHPPNISGLTNLSIHFIPANCTSKLQPLDLGIIRSVKAHYRKSLVRKLLNDLADKKETEKITVLDAMHMVTSAWKDVSSLTIKNSFLASGIGTEEPIEFDNTDVDLSTEGITPEEWETLVDNENVALPEYYNCDEYVLTTDYRVLEEIYEDNVNQNSISEEEGSVEAEEAPPPSFTDATTALGILRRYIISSDIEETAFNILEQLEEEISKTRPKLKQTTIFDFVQDIMYIC